MTTIDEMVARWNDPAARPLFQGRLINGGGRNTVHGDVLRVCGSWTDEEIRNTSQKRADRVVAKLLGISVTHAVLLRHVGDSAGGRPQDVLAHPELILGDQAPRVLEFWRRLDKPGAAALDADLDEEFKAWDVATDAAYKAAGPAASLVSRATWTTGIVTGATFEIQGAALLDKFFFLPLFGISDPAELDAEIDK